MSRVSVSKYSNDRDCKPSTSPKLLQRDIRAWETLLPSLSPKYYIFDFYTTDLVNLYLSASGRHSSYCPSHSRSKSPAERRSGRHHSQYYEEQELDHQTQLQPQQVRERKHSPNCRRHEHNRRHRRQQQEHQKEQQEQHEGGEQGPQSGVYSVDVEYGYNYTRVGGLLFYRMRGKFEVNYNYWTCSVSL